jgi:hypothetical protein
MRAARMKVPRWLGALACLCATAAAPAGPRGEERVRLVLREESRLWLEGDSNVRRWSCEAEELVPELSLERPSPVEPPSRVEEASVRIPVARIDCGIGRMNENLRDALRAVEHPEIRFEVARARFIPTGTRGRLRVAAAGRLTVAGVTRELELDVDGSDSGDGALRIRSEVAIQMTDFGVAPPTALLGLIRTKNEVTIRFDLLADYETLERAVTGEPIPSGS